MIHQIKTELKLYINAEKAAFYPKFFKAGKGEYGEGDQFIGITVPNLRKVAKKFKTISMANIKMLIDSPIHEYRMLGLFILIHQFEKANEEGQKKIFDFYYDHRHQVNNWDLVDCSAHKIMGAYLIDKDKSILYKLAASKNLWDRRIAMISCWAFIRKGELEDTFQLAELLVNDSHDLMHKAVGWMIREAGKKDLLKLETFLKKHQNHMPRTMLRYAIEKLPKDKRQLYLKGIA